MDRKEKKTAIQFGEYMRDSQLLEGEERILCGLEGMEESSGCQKENNDCCVIWRVWERVTAGGTIRKIVLWFGGYGRE